MHKIKIDEPHEDDTCMNCGDYNNEWVICDKCFKEILKGLGVKEEERNKTIKVITRYTLKK